MCLSSLQSALHTQLALISPSLSHISPSSFVLVHVSLQINVMSFPCMGLLSSQFILTLCGQVQASALPQPCFLHPMSQCCPLTQRLMPCAEGVPTGLGVQHPKDGWTGAIGLCKVSLYLVTNIY